MKMTNKKKIFILVGMFALLVVTAVLNYTIAANGNKNSPDDVVPTGSYFTNWRNERLSIRDNEIAYLDTIIANESPEYAETRTAAMEQKLRLIALSGQEVDLEYLIMTAGFEEVAVSIGSASENVYVVVQTEGEFTKSHVANIYTLIYDETGIEPDYVKIIPI